MMWKNNVESTDHTLQCAACALYA